MKNLFLFIIALFLFLINIPTNAQSIDDETIKSNYENYFQHYRESVHLHLNKTTFLVGEEIWWSAYVYNKKSQSASTETRNLYCGIYDESGKKVNESLFLVQNGKASGSFSIDPKLKSGPYYIKAGTLWMKNFDEDQDFIQKITIINKNIIDEEITSNYDLQILPEGGNLIEEAKNTIGIRVIDQLGNGIKVTEAKVFDNEENIVRSFTNNHYGVGKFDLYLEKDKTYKVRVDLDNGKSLFKELPKVYEKGIVISVNNILEDKLVISLKTNERTLKDIKAEKFHLAIHRDGLMTLKSLTFGETTKIINIDKEKILSGVNIMTLFNKDLQPLAERLIFNYNNLNLSKASIERRSKKLRDSVAIKINIFSKNSGRSLLSMSALPTETISNNPQNNIISSFLLDPYLKSPVENAKRYFTDIDRSKEFELDLVLLTQGWSRYNWDTIFNNPPDINYPFEKGIILSGTINSKIADGSLLGYHTGNIASLEFADLENQNQFNINNLYLFNGDKISFTLKNKRKKLSKPDINISFDNLFTTEEFSINAPISLPTNINNLLRYNIATDEKIKIPENFLLDQTIVLEEVTLTEKKAEKKLKRLQQAAGIFNGFKIGEEEVKKSPLLSDFINKNGFRTIIDFRTATAVIINPRPSAGPVEVYLNDVLLRDANEIFNVPLARVDEIYFNKDVNSRSNFTGGTIRIYWKEAKDFASTNPSFADVLVKNSFVKSKEFYRPKYTSLTSRDFKNFGVIHWEPNLVTNQKGQVTVKLPGDGPANIKVYIEGLSEDGSLISHVQEIDLE